MGIANPESSHRSTGIGLRNVTAGMRLYFGGKKPVRIYSREGIGTITIIECPD